MIQLYFVAVVYLLLGSFLLFAERYQGAVLFFVDVRGSLAKNRFWQLSLALIGLALFLGLLFSPAPPGPIVLGDLVPALAVLSLVVHYMRISWGDTLLEKLRWLATGAVPPASPSPEERFAFCPRARRLLSRICFGAAVLHFLLPGFVLL